MKSKEILINIIEELHQFELTNKNQNELSYTDFLKHLNSNNTEIRDLKGTEEQWIEKEYVDNVTNISILVTLMFRYAKGYIKKALKNSLIKTADEFSYLIILMTHQSLTKTELILKNVMEITSGTEVIKRLLAQNLISQFDDEGDKRSTRVALTEKGRAELIKTLPQMYKVATLVSGNLTIDEVNTLVSLLKKLDLFHNEIFIHKKDLELDELIIKS